MFKLAAGQIWVNMSFVFSCGNLCSGPCWSHIKRLQACEHGKLPKIGCLTSESHHWGRTVESLATSGTTDCAPTCTTNEIQQKPLHTSETMRTPIQIKHTKKKYIYIHRHSVTQLINKIQQSKVIFSIRKHLTAIQRKIAFQNMTQKYEYHSKNSHKIEMSFRKYDSKYNFWLLYLVY